MTPTELRAESLEAAARTLLEERSKAFQSRWDDPDVSQSFRDSCTALARAAITAFLAAERERGYALVPREPTAEMHATGERLQTLAELRDRRFDTDASAIWCAMFDAAAPIKPSEKEG